MTHRVVAMLFVAFAVVACSSNEIGTGGDGARTVEVRMSDDLRFDRAAIAVQAGETVRFELINDGQSVHEFLIGDESAQAAFEEEMASGEMHHDTEAGMAVQPGQTGSFEYTFPDTTGELLAGCHAPGHYDAGMIARVTIGQ